MPTKGKAEGMDSINSVNGVRFSLDDVSLDDIIKKRLQEHHRQHENGIREKQGSL